jgi:hypothetical protein
VDEESLRHNRMKVVFCAGQRHLEQAPFLLDLCGGMLPSSSR